MEDEKNTNLKETKSNPADKSFDGTDVFKTSEVTRIIDEAIAMIEETWNGKAVTREVPDYNEMRKQREETKESEENKKSEENSKRQEIDKSDKDWIYKEIIRLENEGKWQELEQFTKSPEFLENVQDEKDWQKLREEYLRKNEYLQRQKESEPIKENKEAEAAEPTGENKEDEAAEPAGENKEDEAAEPTEENKEITKKSKKRDTKSIVIKLKRALIVTGLLLAAFIAGRIIYVNCTYPSTKINMLNQNQKLTGEKYDMAVNDVVICSKEEWVDYLKENIPKDEDFDADSYASLPGAGENYEILYVELSVSNTTDETIEISGIKTRLVLQSGYRPLGYSIFVREKTDNSMLIKNNKVEAGQTRIFVFAYTLEEEFKKDLMLQYCELGNNQRMVLEFKELQ